MWLFYFLFWIAVRASAKKTLYRKIGDKAVLTPASEVNPITSIEWKHGPDLAMEWYGDKTFSYRHFKDRGSLNTSTGALTITGLTPGDSGSYTVEINNKVTSKTQLLVISPVSKPTLSLWCEPEMTYCVLTCNGDTTDAEPVTYWWTSGDITWSSTKEHNITKENNELWFSCVLKNPVSSSSSEKVFNPFNKEPLYGKIGDKAVLTPDSAVNPIYTIVWKHGPYLAMEWFRNGDETYSYRQFKDRGSLNTLTGALTITGLTPDDSGSYTVEINNKVTSKTELLVISPVSKPTLSDWCESKMTYCVLTCNGDTTGAEPVTYWWTSGNMTWSSTKEHKITKEDEELWSSWFSCALKNPVSFNSSEKVPNPFIKWNLIGIIIVTAVFGVILVGFIIAIIYLIYNAIKERLERLRKGEAAERRWQEMSVLLPPVQDTSTQDPTSVVVQDTSNGTVISTISEINKTSTQDLETAESPDTNNETERSTTSPDVPETSTQDPTSVVVQDTSNGTERPASLVVVQETSPQDTTSTVPPETSKETERSTTSPDVPETSTQDPTSVVTQDTSNGTERSTTSPDVPETSTQDQENAVSQDTSNETERSTTSPDVPETSTQDQESAESPDPSNETEKSAMIPDDLDKRC